MESRAESQSSYISINTQSENYPLKPIWQNIPCELKCINRWIVWKGKKVPYNPNHPMRKASVANPSTWGSFEQTKSIYDKGGWGGVGFVLVQDGLVGIDIDKCIKDGKPDHNALNILTELCTKYIEISPSGNGLRAFGYGPTLERGRRGIAQGVNVELYSKGRYLTVTGHSIKNAPLGPLTGLIELAESLHNPTEETEVIEDMEVTDFNISSSANATSQNQNYPTRTIPDKVGQRNAKIFELARWLKGIDSEATTERQREVLKEWLSNNKDLIGTDDFGLSWADFRNSWKKVLYPKDSIFESCIEKIKPLPKIDGIENYGVKGEYLMQVCISLQIHFKSEPFFLSARKAGDICGCHFTHAAKYLQAFVSEGWLEIVEKETKKKSRRYKLSFQGSDKYKL